MRRPLRLTACLSTAAATTAVGVLLAPAASADPGRTARLPAHLGTTSSNAPSVVPGVPPFGRKLV